VDVGVCVAVAVGVGEGFDTMTVPVIPIEQCGVQ
jgi:hypothetical protein